MRSYVTTKKTPIIFTGQIRIEESYNQTLVKHLIISLHDGMAFTNNLAGPNVGRIEIDARQVDDEVHYEIYLHPVEPTPDVGGTQPKPAHQLDSQEASAECGCQVE